MMLSEHCLQHVKAKGDATARAYFRTDQLERRRAVMEQWSAYVESKKVEQVWDAQALLAQARDMDHIIAVEEGRSETVSEAQQRLRFDGLELE